MKKDIEIPEVKNVHIAIVKEYNKFFKVDDWNAYIINDKTVDLDTVLIVTSGYSEDKKTAVLRRKLDKLPAKSYAKLELIPKELFALNNSFKVSFFEGNSLFDKTFLFRKNTVNEKALQSIPLMDVKGVLVK